MNALLFGSFFGLGLFLANMAMRVYAGGSLNVGWMLMVLAMFFSYVLGCESQRKP